MSMSDGEPMGALSRLATSYSRSAHNDCYSVGECEKVKANGFSFKKDKGKLRD